jgi:hypothetical protein
MCFLKNERIFYIRSYLYFYRIFKVVYIQTVSPLYDYLHIMDQDRKFNPAIRFALES